MIARKYTVADYERIAPWYVEHGWEQAPNASILSTSGIIIEDESGPLAVGFLYMTNSHLGFFEWICTRPGIVSKSVKALLQLFETAKKEALSIGIFKLICFANSKTKKLFLRAGFSEMETATLMLWGGDNASS